MKGLVIHEDGRSSIETMPKPEFGEYQMLVKILSGGLCGTDMKILHNKLKGFADYPTILGHEGVGDVVETGSKVRNFKAGDRIVLPYIFGKCGEYFSTWGAFAEYAIAGDTEAMLADGYQIDNKILYEFNYAQRKIPNDLDAVGACLIVTFREVYAAVRRLGFKAGQSIVVFGAGAVGLTFLTFLKLLGLGPIFSVELSEAKLAEAKKMGADHLINGITENVEEYVRKICPEGVDIVLDAAGVPAIMNTGLNLVKDHGDICVYGVTPRNEVLLNWDKAPFNWNLKCIQWPSKMEEAQAHDQIVQWMQEGKLDPVNYYSDVFRFEDSLSAMKLFESGKNLKKIIIDFQ